MSSEWNKVQLSNLIVHKKGFAFKSKDYVAKGVPVVRVSNFTENSISPADLKFVSNEIAKTSCDVQLKEHDIVVATVGSWPNNPASVVGRTICVPLWAENALMNQNAVIIRANSKSKIDQKFIYYQLKSDEFSNHIISKAQGSANQASITLESIFSYELSWPLEQEREDVVEILSALDYRITLLRETNTTLEAIAQALFKSWFVDFDPVRAKAEGREPEGIDAKIAALFPDSFEESELGIAPRGWKVSCVDDFAEIIKGKSYSSKELVETYSTALVTLKSFERGGGFRMDGFKPYNGSYKLSQVVKPGDLIVAYTDVTQAAELIGKPAIVVGVQEYDILIASLDVGIIRPKVESISLQFLYGLFKTDIFQVHTLAHTSGTTVLHLAKNAIGTFKFICPPPKIIEAFTVIAESIAARKQVNIDQIRTLITLRDALLPRLISGQLQLNQAEGVA